ncbi:double-stranded RNA-binding protein 1-like isoform X3 [Impatiens glandulifera]|uniref:double-stranded RNA-binding protein 1-like isoform X3 n=1 Tax=Impatiens glandulifera TaxID=253017 RepID=UPI001FB0ACC4|nr:double-stranded RNA-binding protein 1-like isoform X3 [Impatiens glandulifera]
MFKSELNQLCQRNLWGLPEYSNSKDGPDHDPCFNSVVIVNGVSFQSPNICRTVKAAQNCAAELAFNHFSGSSSSKDTSSASHPLPSVTLTQGNVMQRPLTPVEVKDNKNTPGNVMQRPLTPVGVKDNKNTPAGQHMYKSRLQKYAQKRNMGFPVYSFERQGPSHISQFKCKVTVGGQTYEDPMFYFTLKEAENAAAKIAWEQVSPNEDQEDESVLYKNLLQELVKKRGFIPCYETKGTGPSHIPVFVATVKVGDKVYQGLPATSKKQAEMSAAKSAFDFLKDGPLHLNEQHQQIVCTKEDLPMGPLHSYEKHQQYGFTKENLQMGPLHLTEHRQQNGCTKDSLQCGPLRLNDQRHQKVRTEENLQMGPLHLNAKHQLNGFTKENLQMGPLHLIEKSQQNGCTKETLQMATKVLNEPTTKTAGFSYPPPMPTAVKDGKRPRSPTSCDNVPLAGEDQMTADNRTHHMILVYPRSKMPNLRENDTTVSVPYAHDNWVAVKMEHKSQI